MKYLSKLFEYAESKKAYCNQRLLREFLAFLEEEGYELNESAEAITPFTETLWFREKAKMTQRNYLRDLRRFVEYVYDSEGAGLFPSFMETEYKLELQEKLDKARRQRLKDEPVEEEGEDEEEEVDAEYKAFLEKYEKLTGENI